MIDNVIMAALQEQLTLERTNAACYHALGSALDVAYWPGSADYMHKQAADEQAHADRIAAYLVDRDAIPAYGSIEPVATLDAADLTSAFMMALERERLTTEAIKALYYLAERAEDLQTCVFLHWFVDEQTRSEAELRNYLTQLARLDANGKMVFDNNLK